MTQNPDSGADRPFRLAIIGCGLITQGEHLPAALACRNVEVAALIDATPGRAELVASQFGLSSEVGLSLADIETPLDGAIIATPNHTHVETALACFDRGISTLIEKPLANSVQEGKTIIDEARRANCSVAVGYVSRFRPNVEQLKDLLDRSYFGRVQRFVHQFGTPGGWSPLSAYILKRETSGGGVLVVTGTHFLDRMLYLFGYPTEMALQDDGFDGPEANIIANFQFDDDKGKSILGELRYSKTVALPAGLVIETDRGVIIALDTDEADILFRPADEPEHEISITNRNFPQEDGMNTFAEQIIDFVDACQQGRKPRVDGEQGLQSLELIDDLYGRRSALDSDWYAAHKVSAS